MTPAPGTRIPPASVLAETPLPTASPERRAGTDLLLFAIPSVIWGTTWLAIKFQLGSVAPELSVGWRFALAALLLAGFCAARGVSLRFGAADHARLALLGVLLFGLNYVLVYRSEQVLTSGLVAVLFAMLVFLNLLGGRLFLGATAPGAVWAGAVLGVSGVAFVFWPELKAVRGGGAEAVGIAEGLAATVLASAGNLFSQRLFGRGIGVVPGTALAMGYASLLVILGCAATGVRFSFDLHPSYLVSLVYLALFGSVVAFVSYLTLVRRVGAGRSGYSAAVIPVVAMLASTLFEGYRWTGTALAGMGLVLAGTVLVLRARSRAA